MGNLIDTHRELLRSGQMPARATWRAHWKPSWHAGAAFLMVWTLLGPSLLHGQAAAAPATAARAKPPVHKVTAHKVTAHRRAPIHHAGPHASLQAKPAPGVPAAPPAPPKPNWPAEQPPNPAKVSWDSQGLAIEASNSSLDQILHAVATDTGVRLQGLNQDERIFGNYGPGPAREVLSRLLEGSGYNVVMIGGQGDAPPKQIILSQSTAGSPQPANPQSPNHDDENDAEDQQPVEPQQPMPIRSPFGAPRDRTPQEIQQEMLMRQQQIEQQRQQQQPNSPQ